MIRSWHSTRLFWIRLPEIADASALDEAADRLARTPARGQWGLCFAGTFHIDFRALGTFVDRVRSLDRDHCPIRLAGLSPYCEQIFRFVLRTGDWEMFRKQGSPSDTEELGEETSVSLRFPLSEGMARPFGHAASWAQSLN